MNIISLPEEVMGGKATNPTRDSEIVSTAHVSGNGSSSRLPIFIVTNDITTKGV